MRNALRASIETDVDVFGWYTTVERRFQLVELVSASSSFSLEKLHSFRSEEGFVRSV